jgi:hypothetical protein
MSDEAQQPEQPQPELQPHFPLMLTIKEIEGVLIALRKLPMEVAEGLVIKIRTQATNAINAANQIQTGDNQNV